jgi:hypothetical protein
MQSASDFWILLVNLSSLLSQQGENRSERQKSVLDALHSMSPQTQAVMRRRLGEVADELAALNSIATSESSDG